MKALVALVSSLVEAVMESSNALYSSLLQNRVNEHVYQIAKEIPSNLDPVQLMRIKMKYDSVGKTAEKLFKKVGKSAEQGWTDGGGDELTKMLKQGEAKEQKKEPIHFKASHDSRIPCGQSEKESFNFATEIGLVTCPSCIKLVPDKKNEPHLRSVKTEKEEPQSIDWKRTQLYTDLLMLGLDSYDAERVVKFQYQCVELRKQGLPIPSFHKTFGSRLDEAERTLVMAKVGWPCVSEEPVQESNEPTPIGNEGKGSKKKNEPSKTQ